MYKHIMVPLDGSELAECVLPHVVTIAKGCQVPKVSLVRVVTPLKIYGPELSGGVDPVVLQRLEDENIALARTYMEKAAKKLKPDGIDAHTEVIYGGVLEALTDFIDKNKVDLIVIATHGRSGISRWVWGSVADRILRSAKMPVVMVRPQGCETG
ncbi:MAG: universal stress protein [Dehalococcoidia bacterium]|nr:universal stress protein [Dehalococcoidia bacterium]